MVTERSNDLAALKQFSARIGRDAGLVQGAGGNSSVKADGVLWVKASGTWLADAERASIFVPVDLDLARRTFSNGAEKIPALEVKGAPTNLRPSIETALHAFLPQPIVLHVHSVNALAWCIQPDGARRIGSRLDGLAWTWLPYCRPGLPLAQAVAELSKDGAPPEVLLLANHGLVVAGPDCAEVEALLRDVEDRLTLVERPAPTATIDDLEQIAADGPYRPTSSPVVHGLATDPQRLTITVGGSLYPDHVVFLGPGARVLAPRETPASVARAAVDIGLAAPSFLLVPGRGALCRDDLKPEALAMLDCLGAVLARLPRNAAVSYIGEAEERILLGWDAEQYRRALKRPMA
ncbi:MAG: hypothetical protein QOK29_4508 [Rhodospirillaceae bacterium]|nr:hypothetical protein [Rhodospirillaceae bacterium]